MQMMQMIQSNRKLNECQMSNAICSKSTMETKKCVCVCVRIVYAEMKLNCRNQSRSSNAIEPFANKKYPLTTAVKKENGPSRNFQHQKISIFAIQNTGNSQRANHA